MVLSRRKKFSLFDVDKIFDIVEEQFRKSMEMARNMIERYLPEEEVFGDYKTPLLDILDKGDKYVIEVELPGMNKEDIQVYTYNNTLEIVARRRISKEEKKEGYVRMERAYTGFRRIISLPIDADPEKINAKYENGVLKIEIAKKEEAKKRKIEIR